MFKKIQSFCNKILIFKKFFYIQRFFLFKLSQNLDCLISQNKLEWRLDLLSNHWKLLSVLIICRTVRELFIVLFAFKMVGVMKYVVYENEKGFQKEFLESSFSFFKMSGPKPDLTRCRFSKTRPTPTQHEKPIGLPDPMDTRIRTLGHKFYFCS